MLLQQYRQLAPAVHPESASRKNPPALGPAEPKIRLILSYFSWFEPNEELN